MHLSTPGSIRTRLSDKAAAGIDRLASATHHATDRVAATASAAAHQLERSKDEVVAFQEHWTGAARECVRRHPLASVGIAVGIGLLLSRLASLASLDRED